jgi:HSP20 family protein
MNTSLARISHDPFAITGPSRDPFSFIRDLLGDDSWLTLPSRGTVSYDVEEKDGKLTYEVDMPGVKRDDLVVNVKDEKVTIKGKRANREFTYAASIRGYDPETVDATLEDGVLTLTAEKAKESEGITVQVK